MTDCTHCGGTGNEPDRAELAYRALLDFGAGLREFDRARLRELGSELMLAHGAGAMTREARVVQLESALRDVLALLEVPSPGLGRRNGTAWMRTLTVGYANYDRWMEVLTCRPAGA